METLQMLKKKKKKLKENICSSLFCITGKFFKSKRNLKFIGSIIHRIRNLIPQGFFEIDLRRSVPRFPSCVLFAEQGSFVVLSYFGPGCPYWGITGVLFCYLVAGNTASSTSGSSGFRMA